jgi:hypothetical protein
MAELLNMESAVQVTGTTEELQVKREGREWQASPAFGPKVSLYQPSHCQLACTEAMAFEVQPETEYGWSDRQKGAAVDRHSSCLELATHVSN